MTGILKIHSASARETRMGHSWIEYCPIDGVSVTYGTWGNNPLNQGNGLMENAEPRTLRTNATRSRILDHEQEQRLFDIIEAYRRRGEQAWTLLTPCSTFAAEAWEQATGERLTHQIAMVSTPARLAKAIVEANQHDQLVRKTRLPESGLPPDKDVGNSSGKSSKPTQPRKKRARRH
jgi:hypothetical protein